MAKAPAKTQPVAPMAAVTTDKPDYLKAMEANGAIARTDNFDSTDIAIPRIKLLQGTSPECETFDDAKAGRFWHTGADANLGDSIEFIVCARRKKLLLIAPLDDGQGILARAEDCQTWDTLGEWDIKLPTRKEKVKWVLDDLDVANSGLTGWGTSDPDDKDSPPAATLFYDYLVLLPGHLDLGPAVVSLARSAIRKAKKGLNDKIEMHLANGRPMQAIVFRAQNVDDKNSDGKPYKNWQFFGAGFATEALYRQCAEIAKMMPNFQVRDEADVLGDEDAGPAADSKEF